MDALPGARVDGLGGSGAVVLRASPLPGADEPSLPDETIEDC